MRIRDACWLACVPFLSASPAHAGKPLQTSLQAIHADPALLGRKLSLDACMAIPLSANPTSQKDEVVLYPCGTRTSEQMLKSGILGKLASRHVAKPFNDAGISFDGEVGATFVGTLSKVEAGVDGPDAYFVLTIEQAIAPYERKR